jgi:hypothetical protein
MGTRAPLGAPLRAEIRAAVVAGPAAEDEDPIESDPARGRRAQQAARGPSPGPLLGTRWSVHIRTTTTASHDLGSAGCALEGVSRIRRQAPDTTLPEREQQRSRSRSGRASGWARGTSREWSPARSVDSCLLCRRASRDSPRQRGLDRTGRRSGCDARFERSLQAKRLGTGLDVGSFAPHADEAPGRDAPPHLAAHGALVNGHDQSRSPRGPSGPGGTRAARIVAP